MKRSLVRAICFAVFLFALAVAASAQEGVCSIGGRAGTYAFTWSGTMFLPTGAVPASGVGKTTFDADGNVSGMQVTSRNGVISLHTIKGTYTVNPDCTGTVTITNYDSSGIWVSKASWFTLSADNMTETYLIMTSLTMNNGTAAGLSVPAVITNHAARLFPPKM